MRPSKVVLICEAWLFTRMNVDTWSTYSTTYQGRNVSVVFRSSCTHRPIVDVHATVKPPTSTPGRMQQQRSKFDERSRRGIDHQEAIVCASWQAGNGGAQREVHRNTEAARRSRYSRVFHSPVLDVRRICLGATFEAELAALDDAAVLAQTRPDSQRHFRRVAYLKHEIRSARAGGTSRRTSDSLVGGMWEEEEGCSKRHASRCSNFHDHRRRAIDRLWLRLA